MNPHDKLDLGRLAMEAMQAAIDGVIEKAQRENGTLVVWEDGAVRHVPARLLPPISRSADKSPVPWGDWI